jgi:hypothetical protein
MMKSFQTFIKLFLTLYRLKIPAMRGGLGDRRESEGAVDEVFHTNLPNLVDKNSSR